MKSWLRTAAGLGVLFLAACTNGSAMQVDQAWARPGMKDGTSAVYMILQNHTAVDDELVSASTDAALTVELHESVAGGDGMMMMVPQTSIPVGAGGEVELKPGGLHVMLIGLTRDLEPGGTIDLKLTFRSGSELSLSVPIRDAAGMETGEMEGHMP